MYTLIKERVEWHALQNAKHGPLSYMISNWSFWTSFPWLALTVAGAFWAWTPSRMKWLRFVLAGIAVSESTFVWCFAALYPSYEVHQVTIG